MNEPLILGIETRCDETGVGIVRGSTLLADAVASSVAEHARFGGVVPEVASRAHVEAMIPTIQLACSDAGVSLRDIDAIAVMWLSMNSNTDHYLNQQLACWSQEVIHHCCSFVMMPKM